MVNVIVWRKYNSNDHSSSHECAILFINIIFVRASAVFIQRKQKNNTWSSVTKQNWWHRVEADREKTGQIKNFCELHLNYNRCASNNGKRDNHFFFWFFDVIEKCMFRSLCAWFSVGTDRKSNKKAAPSRSTNAYSTWNKRNHYAVSTMWQRWSKKTIYECMTCRYKYLLISDMLNNNSTA